MTANANAIARPEDTYDPYAAYGAEASRSIGTLLKFAKGHWTSGQEAEAVSPGTRVYANMAGIRVGWMRWEDGKPSDEIMVYMATGERPPKRSELGDHDKALWELDKEGRPRDPWQFHNELPLMTEDGEEWTFSTSSKGGINAIGELCIAYSKGRKQKPEGSVPVVEVGVSSYKHSDKTYGTIYTPVLKLVDWVDADKLLGAPEAEAEEAEAEVEKPAKPVAQKARF